MKEENVDGDGRPPKRLVGFGEPVEGYSGLAPDVSALRRRRQSFRRSTFNNTVGAYQLFWVFCTIRKKRVMQAFSMWKFVVEMLRREEGKLDGNDNKATSKEFRDYQNMKKQCMEARFFARASQHKIKALEAKLNSVHNDKYLKEVATAKAKTDVSQELTAAIARAEVAEALVQKLESDMMGISTHNHESFAFPHNVAQQDKLQLPKPSPPPPRPGSRRQSAGDLLREKKKLVCFKLLLKSSAVDALKSYSTLSKAFYKWKYCGPNSVEASFRNRRMGGKFSAVTEKELAEHTNKTADTAARVILSVVGDENVAEAQLSKEVRELNMKMRSVQLQTFLSLLSVHWRLHWERRVYHTMNHWKNVALAQMGNDKDGIESYDREGTVSEKALVEAESKFDELKRKSDTYQASVKAHWTKTEEYMMKLKNMLSEEKQKRKLLKQDKTELLSEINSLKKQLDDVKKERSQLDFETVRRMMHVQRSLSYKSEGNNNNLLSVENDSLASQSPNSYAVKERGRAVSLERSPSQGGSNFPQSRNRAISLERSLSTPVHSPVSGRVSIGSKDLSPNKHQYTPPHNKPPRPSSYSYSPIKPHSSEKGTERIKSSESVTTSTQTDIDICSNIPRIDVQPDDQFVWKSDTVNADSANGGTRDDEIRIVSCSVPDKNGEVKVTNSENLRKNDSVDSVMLSSVAENRDENLDREMVDSFVAVDDLDQASQWEALYAQTQEQLATEIYAKEESQRSLEFAQHQLEALRAEDAQMKDIVSQLVQVANESTASHNETLAAIEKGVALSANLDSTGGIEVNNGDVDVTPPPIRRGGLIARRNSLSALGGFETMPTSTNTSIEDNSIIGRPSKYVRGRHQTYVLDNSKDESGGEVQVNFSSRSNKSIAFSSNVTQLSFGLSETNGGISDEESEDSNSHSATVIDMEKPILPDVDFSAILEEIEEEASAAKRIDELKLDMSTDSKPVNQALEAAMIAKLPKKKNGTHNSSGSSSVGLMTNSSRHDEKADPGTDVDRVVNTADPMDYIWKIISQQTESSLQSSGSTNVRVAIRMRPLNQREVDLHSSLCVSILNGMDLIIKDDETTIENKFSFDFCFDAKCSDAREPFAGNQQQVFDKLGLEVLTNAWNGYNASLFAYGQTGSGKSYSMMGSDDDPGIIPRVCMALFYLIRRHYETVASDINAGSNIEPSDRQYSVEASYLEIYNERIRDLLDPSRTNLRVREHPQTGVFVENLSTCAVESYKDVCDLLEMGLEQRTTASTNMNSESSRSHSVFTIVIRMQSLLASGKTAVRLCKLCLVDLAGSERAASTGATGARLKEGANINKSLSTLGRCISALAKAANASKEGEKVNIPFRESVLTWLLRESLCGNAKTAMLATISPADVNYGETLSTLRYANSAKMIATKAIVNEDPTTKIINELRKEVLRLREELSITQARGASPGSSTSDGGIASKKLNEKMKEHLLMAENALQTYAKAWEQKEVSYFWNG